MPGAERARRQDEPAAQLLAGGPFAIALTWGLLMSVGGIFMGLVAIAVPEADAFGNPRLSPWLIVGGIVEFVGLLLLATGSYELLRNLEGHFKLSRRRKD